MIYILTGKIRSGKTTALLNWVSTQNNADGLLCPDRGNGKRNFLKIKTKAEFILEAEDDSGVSIDEETCIEIGSFKFLKTAFTEANEYLISNASQAKYLIIDELGKLELKNLGLHLAAQKLIPNYKNNAKQHLILVIRDYLVEPMLKHYAISKYSVLTKEDLQALT